MLYSASKKGERGRRGSKRREGEVANRVVVPVGPIDKEGKGAKSTITEPRPAAEKGIESTNNGRVQMEGLGSNLLEERAIGIVLNGVVRIPRASKDARVGMLKATSSAPTIPKGTEDTSDNTGRSQRVEPLKIGQKGISKSGWGTTSEARAATEVR